MGAAKENLERICRNCCHFFPATMEEFTEFGICLNDEEFEPFIEDLIEDSNYASSQSLVDRKKFLGEREACGEFESIDQIEIDNNTSLGRELSRLMEAGELNPQTFQDALLEDQIRNIDWTTMPVDRYEAQLKDPENQTQAIASLGGMISLGNKEAFVVLSEFLKEVPPPETIEEVHFKRDILRYLGRLDKRETLLPILIGELYRIPSNNTTRQWISDIFRFLEDLPFEMVCEPVERMIRDKRFSYRLKQRMKDILAR